MSKRIFPVDDSETYTMAGPEDFIRLLPIPGCTSIILPKWQIETLAYGMISSEFVHLSGPTGAAKTSVIESFHLVPENFKHLCRALGIPFKPLRLYPVEMVQFDTPGELLTRRALDNGSTYDEKSILVQALLDAHECRDVCYPTVWLCEIGRVHSASIQGGLLNLMTRNDIHLPGGKRIPGRGIAWIADSNYQAENDSTHTLVTFDDALRRRFTVNLTLDYPSASEEEMILKHLRDLEEIPPVEDELITKIVVLGQEIRKHKSEGNLPSVSPPTIYGYEAFLRMAHSMPHLNLRQLAIATLLGNASAEDNKRLAVVFSGVFSLQPQTDEATAVGVI